MFRGFLFIVLAVLIASASPALADSTVFTLWPLVDYRASEAVDYRSVHLLGPIFKHETKGPETEYALRPLFYRSTDDKGASLTEVLYPLYGRKNDGESTSSHFFHLLRFDDGAEELEGYNKSYVFPFFFYGDDRECGDYWAFFPVGGTMCGWFGRDEIEFYLFPLYSRTQRGTTRVDNLLWPFFAKVSGEQELGIKVWPIYGQSQKEGHYRKKFFFWPFFFSEDLRLNTDNPIKKRVAFPFYIGKESPKRTQEWYLWPFFSYLHDRERDYVNYWAPWPLVRSMEGKDRNGWRVLPFYADETTGAHRKRWILWPIYKIEEMQSELVVSRRDRILFFLYSDFKEKKIELGREKRRIALWPLFGYKRVDDVSHLHILALLEPLVPENEGVERSWAPLWRVYQRKWDVDGNSTVSFLWNLYWSERRGPDVAWELFPLVQYRSEVPQGVDFRLLKGLFRFRSDSNGKAVHLFYLPWGVSWGAPQSGEA